MKHREKAQIKKWIRSWQAAGAELEKIRRKEIRNTNTRLAIERLDDAFRSGLRLFTPKATSGLVELERLLARLGGKR